LISLASATTASLWLAITGLKSISFSLSLSISLAAFRITLARAFLLTGFPPLTPSSTMWPLISENISRTSFSVIGNSLKVTSFRTSTNTPPSPNIMTAPNWGSIFPPTMISVYPSSFFCIRIPMMFSMNCNPIYCRPC